MARSVCDRMLSLRCLLTIIPGPLVVGPPRNVRIREPCRMREHSRTGLVDMGEGGEGR